MDIRISKVKKEEDESIVLSVAQDCNLWPYILMDTVYDQNGHETNVNRHVYVFENRNVKAGDYVVLHTGRGVNTSFRNKKGTTTFSYYWGFDESTKIWSDSESKALLVQVSEFKKVLL